MGGIGGGGGGGAVSRGGGGGIQGGGGIKMVSASAPSVNEPKKEPYFSPHSRAKANYKSTNLRKIGNEWKVM